jgi:hypothetical protein
MIDALIWWTGAIVISLATVTLLLFVTTLVLNQMWHTTKSIYSMAELQEAVQQWKKSKEKKPNDNH